MNVYNLANELLLKFFIETDINETFVKDSINEINTLDNEFKMIYDILYNEHNLLLIVTNKLNESENKYLDLLDKLNENPEENNEKIKLINDILELIIEYDSILYKMNNRYTEINEEKLQQILNELNKF